MQSQRFLAIVVSLVLLRTADAFAQEHQHAQPPQQAGHQHDAGSLFAPHEGSGTSWLPHATEMQALHARRGSWELMFHGNAFLQLLHEAANAGRGATQAGSINWMMAMARRPVGGGTLGLRGMVSLEPATIRGCGYPDLLATGEVCDGESIHDRQHPHDFLMEVAAEYQRPLWSSLRWQIYGGLSGEPALGPVAYPHRSSAMPNPIAPIGHHWLDASHITFGVVTTGVFTSRWKAEASIFNGREPDEDRWDLDLAALDSVAGRISFAPTDNLAVQVSGGHLNEAEAGHDTPGRVDVNRVTASVTHHRGAGTGTFWASTLAWGRNEEADTATHALLAETSVTFAQRDVWFGRFEIAGKEAHDLHVEEFGDEVFAVAKLQAGYTRYLATARGWHLGAGGHLSAAFVPDTLKPQYGSRANLGVGFFLTVRPAVHTMGSGIGDRGSGVGDRGSAR